MAKIILIGLCIFALPHLHNAEGKAALSLRSRRYADYDADGEDYDTWVRREVDSNDLREARRIGSGDSSNPPLPEDEHWWHQGSYVTPPPTSPPVIKEYIGQEDKFHHKILPWFKKQLSHTENFFRKNYESAKNSIG